MEHGLSLFFLAKNDNNKCFQLLHLAPFWYMKPWTLAEVYFIDNGKISIFAIERVVLCGILYPTLYLEIDLLS